MLATLRFERKCGGSLREYVWRGVVFSREGAKARRKCYVGIRGEVAEENL